MRRLLAALLVGAACACGCSSAPAASTAPATAARVTYPGASPSAGRYAVFGRGLLGLNVVDEARGSVALRTNVEPSPYHPNDWMAWTSASLTRLYYLNAGSQVDYVTPGGEAGVATTIRLNGSEQAGFAVSPDDKRIAVAILSDSSGYRMRLYVEDLAGGGNHRDIFSSTSAAEWPIGWVGGKLVLAVVHDQYCTPCAGDNPYAASSYHVVDPDTGRRLASLCSANSPPQGPVSPAGVICWSAASTPRFLRWDGTEFPAPAPMPAYPRGWTTLSPDGSELMVAGKPIRVLRGPTQFSLATNGNPIGWIDERHVIVADEAAHYWLLDPRTGIGAELTEERLTEYLGTLPAAIS